MNNATQISTTNERFSIYDKHLVIIEFVYLDDKCMAYVKDLRVIRKNLYRTSLIKSIDIKDDVITVTTRNSVYVFKSNYKIKDSYDEYNTFIEGVDEWV